MNRLLSGGLAYDLQSPPTATLTSFKVERVRVSKKKKRPYIDWSETEHSSFGTQNKKLLGRWLGSASRVVRLRLKDSRQPFFLPLIEL